MEDLSGKQFGPYQIVTPLGEGGMAAVYKAYQAGMDRYVALKVLPQHFASEPTFVKRFEREARIIARLQHIHILPVFDFGESQGYTYIVMPYVESGTLADLLTGEPLPLSRITRLLAQIGDALDYAHTHGVIHRDIKPSNILIDERGNCLLTDFGIGKVLVGTAQLTGTGDIIGTPAYMSPEQALGKAIDARSDLYSLGVMLYEMATGRQPFRAETPMAVIIKHINDPLPLPRAINPHIPAAVESVILKAMSKAREDRYATAEVLVAALEQAAGQVESSASQVPDKASTHPRLVGSEVAVATLTGAVEATLPAGEILEEPSTEVAQAPSDRPMRKRRLVWAGGVLVGVVLVASLIAWVAGRSGPAGGPNPQTPLASPGAILGITASATTAPTQRVPTHTPLPPADTLEPVTATLDAANLILSPTTLPAGMVVMPEVSGMTYEDAQITLGRLGFEQIEARLAYDPDQADGTVLWVEPVSGQVASLEDAATLVVAGSSEELLNTFVSFVFHKGENPFERRKSFTFDLQAGWSCEYYRNNPIGNNDLQMVGPDGERIYPVTQFTVQQAGEHQLILTASAQTWRYDDKAGVYLVDKEQASSAWVSLSCSPPPAMTPTPALGPDAKQSTPQDSMPMVDIPAGEFLMGSTDEYHVGSAVGKKDQKPAHYIYLDAYQIDKYEVTNAQYAGCVAAGACEPPVEITSRTRAAYYGNPTYDNYPVVHVTWKQANAYCAWAGKRLPSEAEWEKAARGDNGRLFPWGDQSPDCTLANFGMTRMSEACVGDTAQVGSYPAGASPYGVLDMAGNVMEWVNDWYLDTYYSISPQSNPPGPEKDNNAKVIRGGGWYEHDYYLRVAYRNAAHSYWNDLDALGFRCAVSVP